MINLFLLCDRLLTINIPVQDSHLLRLESTRMRNVYEEETRHKLMKLCALRLSFHTSCSLISHVSSAQQGISNVLSTILFYVYLLTAQWDVTVKHHYYFQAFNAFSDSNYQFLAGS